MTTTPAAAPTTDWLRLDQQICFSLNAASRAFGGVYRVILKDLGLTYPQYLVMLVLWEHGELPVKKLGEHLRLDSGTLSPLLKRLETAGLVRRERSARDERSVEVRLTDEGVALRERAVRYRAASWPRPASTSTRSVPCGNGSTNSPARWTRRHWTRLRYPTRSQRQRAAEPPSRPRTTPTPALTPPLTSSMPCAHTAAESSPSVRTPPAARTPRPRR
jgi:DNA-binding MarR family transcriptional regulator